MKITINPESETTYSETELKEMFDNVCSKDHWKNPIRAWVKANDLELARQAVEYYTATEVEVVQELVINGLKFYEIIAPGYYAGPCN